MGKTQMTNGSEDVFCDKRVSCSPPARRFNPGPKKIIFAVCIGLLMVWCACWVVSFQHQELLGGKHLWFMPGYTGLGCDFYRHIDYPARTWWHGGDPYADKVIFFPYPPSVVRLFSWVNLMTPRTALGTWLIALVVIIISSAWVACRWRRKLSVSEIPPIVAILLILFSTPVLFAMERGQCDPLSLLFILIALPLLRHPSSWAQFLAGAVLCLTPWVKVYPGLIFVGLIGLQRWRALAGFIIFGLVLLATTNFQEMQRFLANNAQHIETAENIALFVKGAANPSNHPLSLTLPAMWLGTKLSWLGLFPGKILAALILFSQLSWVTYHIYRCPGRDVLIYPYLLWVVALATFVPPVSNDYNLIFLPLAVLIVWDRRDPLPVHMALVLLLIWWQPVALPLSGATILVFKVLGLGAVAFCLVRRAREQARSYGTESLYAGGSY